MDNTPRNVFFRKNSANNSYKNYFFPLSKWQDQKDFLTIENISLVKIISKIKSGM